MKSILSLLLLSATFIPSSFAGDHPTPPTSKKREVVTARADGTRGSGAFRRTPRPHGFDEALVTVTENGQLHYLLTAKSHTYLSDVQQRWKTLGFFRPLYWAAVSDEKTRFLPLRDLTCSSGLACGLNGVLYLEKNQLSFLDFPAKMNVILMLHAQAYDPNGYDGELRWMIENEMY